MTSLQGAHLGSDLWFSGLGLRVEGQVEGLDLGYGFRVATDVSRLWRCSVHGYQKTKCLGGIKAMWNEIITSWCIRGI